MRTGNAVWPEVSFNNSGMNREIHVPLCERLTGRFRRPTLLFAGSPRGAKAGAIFYSLIKTAQANQVEPYIYLRYILNNIRSCKKDEDYQRLFPWNVPADELKNLNLNA